MIDERTYLRSIVPGNELSDRNIVLVPMADTPLSVLHKSSDISDRLVSGIVESEDLEPGELATIIQKTTGSDNIDNISLHDKALGDTVDTLSNVVKSHISNARTVVKPIVLEMLETMEEFIANNSTINILDDFNIIIKKTPPLLTNTYVTDELDGYVGRTLLYPDLKAKLKSKTYDDILPLLLTGNNDVDKLIVDLVSEMSVDTIVSIYTSFLTTEHTDDVLTYQHISMLSSYDKMNYGIVIYLLARGLINTVDNDGWDVPLSVYNKTLMELRDYAGTLVALALQQTSLLVRTKQLVLSKDMGTKSITVSGEVYTEWLNSGGSPEVVLGILVSDTSNDTSIPAIDSKSKDYINTWASFTSFYTTSAKNKLFRSFKDFLLGAHNNLFRELTPIEEEYNNDNSGFRDNVSKLVTDTVNTITHKDMDDLSCLALKLVARDRFYFTSAYGILNDIQEATIANPDINVREAALLAAINYITDYALDQISIKSWN